MAYIDHDYYSNNYKGQSIEADKFDIYAERASDVIDQLTRYKLKTTHAFDRLAPFLQEQVMKATAAQVEFYELNGGYDIALTGDDVTGVSVGKFSYGGGNRASGGENPAFARNLIDYLAPTGLLFSGVGVRDSAY
ncbi:hypothetical protein EH196_07050 [Bacillus sp. C1-1]|nr:hypothetical protein EH196_07050 [Bacillus sp. C1-1]